MRLPISVVSKNGKYKIREGRGGFGGGEGSGVGRVRGWGGVGKHVSENA